MAVYYVYFFPPSSHFAPCCIHHSFQPISCFDKAVTYGSHLQSCPSWATLMVLLCHRHCLTQGVRQLK